MILEVVFLEGLSGRVFILYFIFTKKKVLMYEVRAPIDIYYYYYCCCWNRSIGVERLGATTCSVLTSGAGQSINY